MTTILIDFDNHKVYADKRTTNKQIHSKGVFYRFTEEIEKIIFRNGTIIVGTGSVPSIQELVRVMQCPQMRQIDKKELEGGCDIIAVNYKGGGAYDIIEYDLVVKPEKKFWGIPYQSLSYDLKVSDVYTKSNNFITMGSGGRYAYAVRDATGCPHQAMKTAGRCDSGTSMNYIEVCLKTGELLREFDIEGNIHESNPTD